MVTGSEEKKDGAEIATSICCNSPVRIARALTRVEHVAAKLTSFSKAKTDTFTVATAV